MDVAGSRVVSVAHEQAHEANHRRLRGQVANVGHERVVISCTRDLDEPFRVGSEPLDHQLELTLFNNNHTNLCVVGDREILNRVFEPCIGGSGQVQRSVVRETLRADTMPDEVVARQTWCEVRSMGEFPSRHAALNGKSFAIQGRESKYRQRNQFRSATLSIECATACSATGELRPVARSPTPCIQTLTAPASSGVAWCFVPRPGLEPLEKSTPRAAPLPRLFQGSGHASVSVREQGA